MDMFSRDKAPHRLVLVYIPRQLTVDDIDWLPIGIFVQHPETFPRDFHCNVSPSLYVWWHLNSYNDTADVLPTMQTHLNT